MYNLAKIDRSFLKLLNKITKHGKKYRVYLYIINTFYYYQSILRNLNIGIVNVRFISDLRVDIFNSLPFFTKVRKGEELVSKFLVKNKRFKEFLKWFYILLYIQPARKFNIKILGLILELLILRDNNNIFVNLGYNCAKDFKKKKIRKDAERANKYLGNL